VYLGVPEVGLDHKYSQKIYSATLHYFLEFSGLAQKLGKNGCSFFTPVSSAVQVHIQQIKIKQTHIHGSILFLVLIILGFLNFANIKLI